MIVIVGNLTTLSGIGIQNNYTCIIEQLSHFTKAHGPVCSSSLMQGPWDRDPLLKIRKEHLES